MVPTTAAFALNLSVDYLSRLRPAVSLLVLLNNLCLVAHYTGTARDSKYYINEIIISINRTGVSENCVFFASFYLSNMWLHCKIVKLITLPQILCTIK